jgi:hypothetical protein
MEYNLWANLIENLPFASGCQAEKFIYHHIKVFSVLQQYLGKKKRVLHGCTIPQTSHYLVTGSINSLTFETKVEEQCVYLFCALDSQGYIIPYVDSTSIPNPPNYAFLRS